MRASFNYTEVWAGEMDMISADAGTGGILFGFKLQYPRDEVVRILITVNDLVELTQAYEQAKRDPQKKVVVNLSKKRRLSGG